MGEPVSYNQELNEIFDEWGQKVAKLTGYTYVPEAEEEKETAKTQPVNC